MAPIVYRSDTHSTDNYGGTYDETLQYEPSGSTGSWSGLRYGSGSGDRVIDTFGDRTYTRKSSSYNVSLKLS